MELMNVYRLLTAVYKKYFTLLWFGMSLLIEYAYKKKPMKLTYRF